MKKNWEIKTLGDVCEIKSGSTPLRSNKLFWENGNFPWFTIDDIREQGRIITNTKQNVTELALSKLTIYPIDTILLCCTASVGEYAITKIPITSNQQFNGLTIKDSSLLIPEFLFYYSSTLKDLLLEKSGKTTIDFVSQAKVKEIPIPIPPIKEQEEIVEKLDKGFELIDSLKETAKKNLENAKELFQSVLREELSPKDGWETKTLGEVCDFVRGLTYSKNDEVNYSNNAVLRSNNIDPISLKLNLNEIKYINDSIQIAQDKIVQEGTIMICTANGSKSHLGKVAYIDKNYGYAFGGFMGLLKPKESVIPIYLYYSLITPIYKDYISKLSDGVNINNLKFSDLSIYSIPIPPIQEQEEIVGRLDRIKGYCEELEGNYKRVLELCEELKQGLLREAFEVK
ncbi:MAG: restriction endonuclease subunit S [Bacteroidales bacterium]|nr:restriction endonuclease subunit S [Bacteroidales bacterium]MDD4683977.1 restriction endonuclease subunit S [Bacteroidales bacterium]